MKAVVRRNKKLVYEEILEPVPVKGQVLARTLCCGICGSDLHALHSFEKNLYAGRKGEREIPEIPNIVFGHEFCAEILDFGPETDQRLKAGTRVVSVPIVDTRRGLQGVGYSSIVPGGFAERMVLTEKLLLPVTNGLSDIEASMTEPFAVGEHAVVESAAGLDAVHLILGCGPVGLAILAALKSRNVGPVIAADFSPTRRAIAERMGADIVVDPREQSPHDHWAPLGAAQSAKRTIENFGLRAGKRAVVFECVGVPGILASLVEAVPSSTQIVVAGVCMETDHIEPSLCIHKQIEFKFVYAYSPQEFAATLDNIAEGRINVMPVITDEVGLPGVAAAFAALGDPETQCKIVVRPSLS